MMIYKKALVFMVLFVLAGFLWASNSFSEMPEADVLP